MAEKKSWRDYYKNSSTEDKASTEKTGTWRDYMGDKSTTGKTASGSWRNHIEYDPAAIVGNNVANRVNSWLQNHNSYITDYQKRYEGRKGTLEDAYVSDSADWLNAITQRKAANDAEAEAIIAYIEQNKDYLDLGWVNRVSDTIANARKQQSAVIDSSAKDNEFWNSFNNEELVKQYGSAEEAYKYYQRNDGYSKKYTGMTYEDIWNNLNNLEEGEERDWLINNQANIYGDTLRGSADFQDYANKGATLSYTDFGTETRHRGKSRRMRSTTSIDKYRAASMALYEHYGNEKPENAYKSQYNEQIDIYRTMTDEEFNTLAYCIAKDKEQGTNLAERYVDSLEGTLKTRRGTDIGNAVKDIPVIADLYGVVAGLDQFATGLEALVTDKDYYVASPYQVASGVIRDSMADDGPQLPEWLGGASLRQGLYDFTTTTSNMAPSILASAAVGALNPVAGTVVGNTLMGASAAGNAYSDAINRGFDKSEARFYSTAIGASEAVLGAALGGISKLGGVGTKLSKALSGIDNGLLRFSLQYGGKIASEGIEEGLQEILDPILQNAILGADEDINWSEVAYSALLGGLSAGVLELGGTISQTRGEQALKKQYGGNTDALIQEGLESDITSESYDLATQYKAKTDSGKSLTGAEIRQLLAANKEQVTPKDMKKIQQAAEKRLTELGQTENVSELAEIATKWATGQEITRAEKKLLTHSEYGSRVANELLPQNIDSGGHSTAWAEEIGTKQVNAAQYNKKAIRTLLDAMASMEDPNAYKPLESRVEAEEPVKVSDTGKAVIRGKDEEIDLTSPTFKQITEDGAVLDVNGKTVHSSEIDYGSEDQGLAINSISKIEHITPAAASALYAKLDMGKSVMKQLNGMDEAFTYGFYNYSEADLEAGNFVGNLTQEQKTDAYKLGKYVAKQSSTDKAEAYKQMRTAAQAEAEKAAVEGKASQKAKNLTVAFNKGNGEVVSIDEAGITDAKQSGAVEVAKILHKMGLGTRVEFFESKLSETLKDKKGNPARVFINDKGNEQRAYSGVYRKSDGTIRVDLNAYNGRGLTLNALAHELTHFIQQWSDRKYKVLVDFLMKEYEKTDMTMRERVLKEQARLEGIRGEKVSYNEAYDEVVANAMSKMFDDGNLVEKLAKLKEQDKNLAQKLWEGFKKIMAKFIGIYEKEGALFKDAADLMEMKDTFEQLQNMFAEALVEASENYQASLSTSESQTLTEAGIGFDEDTKSVYSLHFSTAYQDEIKVGKKTFDTEAIAKIVAKGTGRSIEDARKWVQSELTIANIVMANPEFLDFEADNRYEAIKKNSDYPQGTVDLSNLCPKREEFTTMFDMLQKKYPNKLFTAQDVAEMRKILSDNDITVACGACFVEDRRQLIGEIADTYINMWKEAVETGKPLQKTNAAGQKSDLLVTKALAKQYGLTPGTKIVATDNYIPNQYDLTTYEGFKLLEKNHPTIAMGFNRYNNSRGQQSARLIEGRAEYKRQILGWSDAKVRSVNNNGGLRIFSFSDFEVVHLLDLVQVIIDCAAKGVKIQGYTKIPAFAKLVRDTGIKLNRSLIPKGDNGYHMENGKVVLDYDTTEGININDDNFIDESNNPDVGNIVIGINPIQIGAAMLDPFIDYIIPFHSNKAKEILRKLGTGEWVNYKESQHEKDISTGTSSKHNVNIYTEVINKYHPTSKVEFVEAFLKECKRQGKIPRYAEFLNVDANGDYTYREGYHKLLVDFKMFDADGNILPQGNITPKLDEGFMTELLKAEVDKKQNYEFPQKVYDDIDKKFGENGLDNSSVGNENKLTENQSRGEVNDNRRVREGTAEATEVLKPDGERHTDYSGTTQEKKSWKYLSTSTRKRITSIVDNHIASSKNYEEIFDLLCRMVGKSEDEITAAQLRKAIRQISETIYAEAVATHPVLFESNWAIMGETSKLRKDILEAEQVDTNAGEQYSSQETDADYMDAVNRGDTETAQKVVYDAAKNAGYEHQMFHETDAENIHVFDISRGDHGATDYETPYGIFTKTSAKNIGLGSKQMPLLVKAQNTLYVENREDVRNKIPGFEQYYNQIQEIDSKYDALANELEDEEFDALAEWIEENPDADMDVVYPTSYIIDGKPADIDSERYQEAHRKYQENKAEWSKAYDAVAVKAKEFITDYLRNNEYDSMYFKVDGGSRGRQTDSLIVLDPNQVKSAKPVTYDDDGNVIPLSKRFDMTNDDIRFSEHDTDYSNRSLLANAFEGITQNSNEYKLIQEYKGRIRLLNEQEEKLSKLNAEIRKIRFGKGEYDAQKLRELEAEAKNVAQSINRQDKKLLSLEASEPLRKVIERERLKEREMSSKKLREVKERYRLQKEVKESELLRDIRETRAALKNQKNETSIMEKEFIRIAKAYEKLDANSTAKSNKDTKAIADLKTALKEESKKHRDDQKTWEAEFNRLMREYELADRSIDRLEEKIERQKQAAKNKVESRQKTELRHKIRKTIRDLDKILNRGNKKLNVKEDVQNVVTKALQAADILFTDNYGTHDMLRNGIGADLSDAEEALVATCTRMLKDLDKMPTDGYDNFQARQEAERKLKAKMSNLKDVFARERKRLNNTKVSTILGELADAYASLEKSEQSYVQGAYTEAVHNFLDSLKSEVGGAIVKDMTKDQLEYVYTAYKMVLTTVRKANQMHNEGLKMSREQLGNAVIQEVMNAGGVHGLWTKAEVAASRADWNNMKPIWVANRIGSETFGKLMQGLFQGQYNFAVDVEEAKQFKLSMDEKYKPRSWDAEKLYEFESSTGKKFSLNLQQIMSLYAFSKREQAYSHLLNGGFVFEGNSTVIVDEKGRKKTYIHNGATSYKLNEANLNEIINSMSKEQKAYVDEMQKYLSEVMGAKGNEVSMALYGIKMFKEQFYFPLRSSGAYMERAKEAEMKKQQGQINLVNSGFTHAVKPEAKNPIILSGFMDVWAEHCNEMSMYHSMVLPMEDFRKVYNYSTVHDDKVDSASVFQTIQDAYGRAATDYIDQLYRELNAGATVDPRETTFKKLVSNFKKTAVMLSASVVVQQFSSIGRAYAVIDPKYFIGTKVNSGTQLSVAEEMKKYAPVAIIKEMGGFDTGTKGSAKSYIMAEKYGKGERIQGLVKDEQYRSDIMGYLPAKADEKTWCAIWEAAKRETKVKHPDMDVKSEEFLKLAGDRFSEVIEKTQVYDSVLARSANMRSKTGLMQMATAFLAEPTTTVNLLEDAIRRGNKKYMARAFGAVAVSIVLNNALASIVYAMRDDDEDETFIEKYFQSFTSGMIDDINPMTYYPFLKDVWSLFQGYDVERADMSVIADVRDALKKTISLLGKDTSNMDDDELAEHYKAVNSAILSLLDAGCSVFGVPFKNVRREANGIINAFNTVGKDLSGERTTTWNSFWDKVGSAVKDTIPVYAWTKDKSKGDKLYDAIMLGDKAYLIRLKSTYKNEDAYKSAVRNALRENDPRIHAAAQARYEGNIDECKRIYQEIKKEGKFDPNDIMEAIYSEEAKIRNELKHETESSDYSATDFVNAVIYGETGMAQAMKDDIIAAKVANGKTQEEAEEAFIDSVKTSTRNAFDSGLLDEAGTEKMLLEYAGMDEEEAAAKVDYWAFIKAHPQYRGDFSQSNVEKYHEFAEPANISLEVYAQFINGTKGLTDIKDEWGNVEVSKREQVLEVIDSLPLTWQQKDALYLAYEYAESKIWDVPW